MKEKEFVNGFSSWMETYTEVAMVVSEKLKDLSSDVVNRSLMEAGTGGICGLCERLTDEFEELNKRREWDGEFFDEIDAFLKLKLE